MIDTCVLIRALNAIKFPGSNPNQDFCLRLLKELNTTKTFGGGVSPRSRRFYISALGYTEFMTRVDVIDRFKKAFEESDLIPLAYDYFVAKHIKDKFYDLFKNGTLNEIAKSLHFQSHELEQAREILHRDILILGTSDQNSDVDVIITSDEKTMFPASIKMGIDCALARPEAFEVNSTNIIRYDHQKAKDLLGL